MKVATMPEPTWDGMKQRQVEYMEAVREVAVVVQSR
jgi:hypothetical protein